MPKSVERCVKKVSKTKPKDSAWAICQASHKKKTARKKKR